MKEKDQGNMCKQAGKGKNQKKNELSLSCAESLFA